MKFETVGRDVSYVVHRTEAEPPKVQIKIAQTTRGATFELNAHAGTVEEAMALLVDAEQQVRAKFKIAAD